MSHGDTNSPTSPATTQNNSPIMPNGKASAVAPKLSDGDHVELSDMLPGGPATNVEEDIIFRELRSFMRVESLMLHIAMRKALLHYTYFLQQFCL
jgi:hypothetical protein